MQWNWQLPDWPQFRFDEESILKQEREFLLKTGSSCAFLKNVNREDQAQFIIEILSTEGMESSKIEGEILDRESLQSSIKKHFGLVPKKGPFDKESRMGSLLYDVYQTFEKPLTHE